MDILRIKGEDGQWRAVPVILGGSSEGDGVIKTLGDGLKLVNGELAVDMADSVSDVRKPISAAAVHMEVGNIEVLLSAL